MLKNCWGTKVCSQTLKTKIVKWTWSLDFTVVGKTNTVWLFFQRAKLHSVSNYQTQQEH